MSMQEVGGAILFKDYLCIWIWGRD